MQKKGSEKPNIDNIRHSLAHLLAASVRALYPGAKNAIGPSIEHGFYQDFELPSPVTDKDFPIIEKKMRELLKTWKGISRREVSPEEAKKEFAWNEYKCELIDEFAKEGKTITFYTMGDFLDLCKGGHAEDLSVIDPDSFMLDRVAGAYWRGNENNPMLTRIYGLAFHTKKELDEYRTLIEEAKKRDHKKLGPQLDLFTFSDLVGPGLPLWTPKGTVLRNILDDFVWELRKKYGYQKVEIPHVTKKDLYETSGHWDKFKDELFRITTREGHLFAMKPMNCPHHTQIYARRKWSYRELPQRYANTTMCYRDEQTGELAGLSRVRSFTQDDAHVFCRFSQAKTEMGYVWDIVKEFYGAVGLPLEVRLSLHDPEHPEKYLGDKKQWEQAEDILREVVEMKGGKAIEARGEAAFYGPKIDFGGKDSLKRMWQVATIQLDMNMPERFDLTCANEKGEDERIVMIHAAIMGSIERFLSVVIEHFAGAFPVWLAPVQVMILPVGEGQADYAQKLHELLTDRGIRAEFDAEGGTLGKRIRNAELQKVPYTLVVGKEEEKNKTVSVRKYGEEKKEGKTDNQEIGVEEFLGKVEKEIRDKEV